MHAAQANRPEIVQLLVQKGHANVDITNNIGQSALHMIDQTSVDLITYLACKCNNIKQVYELKLSRTKYVEDWYIQRMLTNRLRELRSLYQTKLTTEEDTMTSIGYIRRNQEKEEQTMITYAIYTACEVGDKRFIQYLITEKKPLYAALSPYCDEILLCCAIRCRCDDFVELLVDKKWVDIKWRSSVSLSICRSLSCLISSMTCA